MLGAAEAGLGHPPMAPVTGPGRTLSTAPGESWLQQQVQATEHNCVMPTNKARLQSLALQKSCMILVLSVGKLKQHQFNAELVACDGLDHETRPVYMTM